MKGAKSVRDASNYTEGKKQGGLTQKLNWDMVDARDTCFEVLGYIVGLGRGSENVTCFEGTSEAENSDGQRTISSRESVTTRMRNR